MKVKNQLVLILILSSPAIAYAETGFNLKPAVLMIDSATQVAPQTGWAGTGNGTTGGQAAKLEAIYLVKTIDELQGVIAHLKDTPKIIQIEGVIDVSGGEPFKDFDDQKKRGQVFIPSNTTLIGVSKSSGFKQGTLIVKDAQNVIIRNLYIEMPVDVAPKIEKDDGWNAEWDGINLINAQYVWLDHLTLTDGPFQISDYKIVDNLPYIQHDGMIDIKRESDFVTISWSHFKLHDKTMLIGHSDKFEEDRGKLHVTIHNTVFEDTSQRMPRIRYGKVHSYNNVFIGNSDKSATAYPFGYAFGLGFEGSILSENNVFDINNPKSKCSVVHVWNDNATFNDNGSLFNHQSLNWLENCNNSDKKVEKLNWEAPYKYDLTPSEQLRSQLINRVGVSEML